ncbi:MAG TPA: UbiA-like polyprenyltransferase [Gaiellaceae bacterium]|nr:UbiA-like polyprenyltransferase [Gaiellaceae bacterium]
MTSVAVLPRRFASLVKIEHTVFALPFAYIGALLCRNEIPSAHDLIWITLAMVGARSLAMSINRLVDAEIDARNPRTATRELPSGMLTRVQVIVFCALALALYLLACFQLEPIVRYLAPIPIIGFVVYPYLKRFTWASHFWLGAVDGLAPVGAWVAITGRLPWESWALGLAVATWIAGFDLFYSLFDRDVDLEQGLHSVSARFGVEGAFVGARLLHIATVLLLAAVGAGLHLGWLYWLGVGAVAVLLAWEHSLVRPGDLRRLDAAFFSVNGLISVVFLGFVLAEVAAA